MLAQGPGPGTPGHALLHSVDEFVRALMSSDSDDQGKSWSSLVKRVQNNDGATNMPWLGLGQAAAAQVRLVGGAPMQVSNRPRRAARPVARPLLHVGEAAGLPTVLRPSEPAQLQATGATLNATPQLHAQSFAHHERCTMSLWSRPFMNAIRMARSVRGRQSRPFRIGSICSGLGAESTVLRELQFGCEEVFTCDIKESSIRVILANRKPQHHFLDLRSLVEPQRSCKCAVHGFAHCSTEASAIGHLDVLSGGISCQPYSMCRTGRRMEGLDIQHKDLWMAEAWLGAVLRYRPALAILENVCGFAMMTRVKSGSHMASCSPLRAFLHRLDVVGLRSDYSVKVYLLRCQPFLPQLRRRVYVQMIRKVAGGDTATTLAERLIEDWRALLSQ